jgi:hypothetical protein
VRLITNYDYKRLIAVSSLQQSNNQTIKQSNNQTIKQSNNQTIKQSNNQTIKQSNNQTIKHIIIDTAPSINRPIKKNYCEALA